MAATIMEKIIDRDIPSDLIRLILPRFPVNSLLRFKCVSKQWYNWISDPCCHGQRLTENPYFFYITPDPVHCNCSYLRFTVIDGQGEKLHEFALGTYNHDSLLYMSDDYMNIVPFVYSCNGLVCFGSTNFPHCNRFDDIYVCNPTTRELITLPRLHNTQTIPVLGSWSCITFGFGYLPSLQEYRIARLHWDYKGENIICSVLNLIPNKVWGRRNQPSGWRVTPEMFPCKKFHKYEAVFANECLYWLTYDDKYCELQIVYFNLSSEEVGILPLPSDLEEIEKEFIDADHDDDANERDYLEADIVNFGGVLSFLVYHENLTICKLWVLKDQDDCIWINMDTIDTSTSLLPRMANDEVLIKIKDKTVNDTYFYNYNLENKEFRRVKLPIPAGASFGVYNTEYLASIAI